MSKTWKLHRYNRPGKQGTDYRGWVAGCIKPEEISFRKVNKPGLEAGIFIFKVHLQPTCRCKPFYTQLGSWTMVVDMSFNLISMVGKFHQLRFRFNSTDSRGLLKHMFSWPKLCYRKELVLKMSYYIQTWAEAGFGFTKLAFLGSRLRLRLPRFLGACLRDFQRLEFATNLFSTIQIAWLRLWLLNQGFGF